MKRILTFIIVLVATLANAQQMQQLPALPNDAATRIGKLDNGLTYYIRHNEYPEHVANFYIAQRVGSIQENDDQRGLAHFLEHMAFNGSTHFKGNEIIEYTRSLGVAFGNDLNAYTSIEQTVYNIDNVPTARQAALDSCLMILQDWSNGLLLPAEEIDKERGVIHGEWAMRNSANQRLFERNLPALYPGNKYGYRLPIGTMEIVDNFEPEALRAYYRKWYHPENQAIIVIGDIDVDHTEAMIKKMFGDIKAGADAAHVEPVLVEDNEEAIYVFDKDKEMQRTTMEIMMKNEPLSLDERGTIIAYIKSYITSMISMMFNSRSSELALDPDCPFTGMSLGFGDYMLSSTKECAEISASAKEDKEKETMAAMVRELKRVKEFGFNTSELVRAKDEFMSQQERAYDNRNKRKNTEYYNECLSHFLHGYAMPDAETDYQIWQQVSQMITLDVINEKAKELITIDQDKNLVVLAFAQDKEGKKDLTVEEMKQIVAGSRNEQVTAWVDNTKDEPLIAKLPKAGKIKKETKNDVLGYTELLLSNGAKVILKKTDFKDNEVLLDGWAPGGSCLYGEKDYDNLKVFGNVTSTFGLGNFSSNELEKALAGKQAGVSVSLGRRYNNVSGHSTPKDLETMMQLLYLSFTAQQKDEKEFNTLMDRMRNSLKNRDLQPETALNDTLVSALYCGNTRFSNLTLKDLDNISLDRILEITRERFSNVNNFTFTVIGNFDEAVLRKLICQYIASLPGKEKKATTSDTRTFFNGRIDNRFTRKMETPKPYIVQIFKSDIENTLKNQILNDYTNEVLSMVLLKTIREDASATYSIGAGGGINADEDKSYAIMQIVCPVSDPTKVDTVLTLIPQCIDQVVKNIDPEMVAKVKANLLKNADVNAKRNGYWQGVIQEYNIWKIDTQTDYKKLVEATTPAEISAYLKDVIMSSGNTINIVMTPQE